MSRFITLEDVKSDPRVATLIRRADEQMAAIGYTEHGFRHVGLVAENARRVLQELSLNSRLAELAAIAGYLHDIGNTISRQMHSKTGAVLAFQILSDMGMDPEEASAISAAIGNHDEQEGGVIVSPITAAVVLADKSDVHRSRVRNPNMAAFDIHDRINYAAQKANLIVSPSDHTITLDLSIDTSIGSVFEYFEIFMSRMLFSRKAAEFLGHRFRMVINGIPLL
ncbi:MAG: HD domain-containing protein [Armatimonadetes bacterium]|nr:HD domain-containing protein [Armatimonadota bacterium]MDW8122222.1 HD domain-containing protein [Armatimonadota bacterium]